MPTPPLHQNASLIIIKDPRQTAEDAKENGQWSLVFHDGLTLNYVGRYHHTPADVLTLLRSTVFALVPGKAHIDHVQVIHTDPDPKAWGVNYNPTYEQTNALRVTIV